MDKSVLSIISASALLVAMMTPAVGAAASPLIEAAKADCLVGEQSDGYLGFPDEAEVDDALRREVRDVNQQRKAFYADLAAQNGVNIEVTAALTAEKLINAAPDNCYRNASGEWVGR